MNSNIDSLKNFPTIEECKSFYMIWLIEATTQPLQI